MKILLFITGHDQVKQYNYFNTFLKSLNLNALCDVYIYCNNPNISTDVLEYYKQFNQKNKYLLITTLNSGHRVGGVEAISVGLEMGIFKNYDYVIHIHPDVFITDDKYLLSILEQNIDNDIVFFITKSLNDYRFFSFDFFIFKPKLLSHNIFKDELYSFTYSPEYYLHDMIKNNDIKYTMIKRFNNDNWYPRRIDDNLKLYHEHDLTKVEKLLKDKELI